MNSELSLLQFSFLDNYSSPQITGNKVRGSAEVTMECHVFAQEKKVIFGGLSNGTILLWKQKSQNRNKHESTTQALMGHKGTVASIMFVPDLASGLLFSGSADRTIRVWDPWSRDSSKICIQTLVGHGGTITALAYVKGSVVSCSSDSRVYIWKSDKEREMLFYPWFINVQVIDDFHNALVHCVSVHDGEASTLYVGDSRGVISVYSSSKNIRNKNSLQKDLHFDGEFSLSRPQVQIHELGICCCKLVIEMNFLLTVSFDMTVKVTDATTGYKFFSVLNPNRCRFTYVHWIVDYQELVVTDETGELQIWNIYSEKCLATTKIKAGLINGITITDNLFIFGTTMGADIWKSIREMHSSDFRGHEAPLVGLVWADKLFSASLDNTVRLWDSYNMTSSSVFRSDAVSEISALCCLTILNDYNFLFTGHDDGAISLYNIDASSVICITNHQDTVSSLEVFIDNKVEYLASVGYDGKLIIWDISRRKTGYISVEHVLDICNSEIFCVKVNCTLRTIYSGCRDGTVRSFDIANNLILTSTTLAKCPISRLCLDGNLLIGVCDKVINIWDIHSFLCVSSLHGHTSEIMDLILVPCHGYLISCSENCILLWDYVSGSIMQRIDYIANFTCLLLYVPPLDNNGMIKRTKDSGEVSHQISRSSRAQSREKQDIRAPHSLDGSYKILAGTEANNILIFPLLDEIFYRTEFKNVIYTPETYENTFVLEEMPDILNRSNKPNTPTTFQGSALQFTASSAPRPISSLNPKILKPKDAFKRIHPQKLALISNAAMISTNQKNQVNLNSVKPLAAAALINPVVMQALESNAPDLIELNDTQPLRWKPGYNLPSKSRSSSLFSPLSSIK